MIALARLGMGDEAMELFHLLNPINHARNGEGVERYKAEPYAVPADVYAHPCTSAAGLDLCTGSAGWMYQAAVQALLGLQRSGSTISIKPCIPTVWPRKASLVWRVGRSRYRFVVSNPDHLSHAIARAQLDGADIDPAAIPLVDDGEEHLVSVLLGSESTMLRAATAGSRRGSR